MPIEGCMGQPPNKENSMKKKISALLPVLMCLCVAMFVSCEEVEEVSKYDNWQARNTAFADSLKNLAGDNFVYSEEQALAIPVGTLFALKDEFASTNKTPCYIYCKKITDNNTDGKRPTYTDTFSAFYYGTLINGERFDGNFTGYSATDRGTLSSTSKQPTEYDSPSPFSVNGNLVSGWKTAVQFMRSGERWMVYIPHQSAYGVSASGTIPAYSLLTFDLLLAEVAE